jgi:hypothetical protein
VGDTDGYYGHWSDGGDSTEPKKDESKKDPEEDE